MVRRITVLLTACVLGAAGQSAVGAPLLKYDFDLFDHLASTFPIEDWVSHARTRSNAFMDAQPTMHPRIEWRAANTVLHDPELAAYAVGSPEPCSRDLISPNSRWVVAPNPCFAASHIHGTRLPRRLGMSPGAWVDMGDVVREDALR